VKRRWLGSGDVRGFTMIETIVSMALLGVVAITVLGGLLFGMTQTHGGLNRAAAAAWAQAELDYLRAEGYSNLATGTRTLTPTSGYTTYGSISEPTIPAGFDHAVVSISAVGGVAVKQATVTLYQSPSSAYATLSIYVANYSHP
jgi:prepilin-type N-terminal cleavage/methylation domain-containing protein